MRPHILEDGYRPLQKVILNVIKIMTGGMVPGPMLALSYRRELCGQYLAACYQEGMRRAGEWSVAEVEIFAAFVSKLNACRY
jgi:hypothetical protein